MSRQQQLKIISISTASPAYGANCRSQGTDTWLGDPWRAHHRLPPSLGRSCPVVSLMFGRES